MELLCRVLPSQLINQLNVRLKSQSAPIGQSPSQGYIRSDPWYRRIRRMLARICIAPYYRSVLASRRSRTIFKYRGKPRSIVEVHMTKFIFRFWFFVIILETFAMRLHCLIKCIPIIRCRYYQEVPSGAHLASQATLSRERAHRPRRLHVHFSTHQLLYHVSSPSAYH